MTIQKISRLLAYLNTRYILITNEIEERKQWVKNLERLQYDEQLSRDRYEEIRGEIDEIRDELTDLKEESAFLKETVESLQSWEI
jgi:predicted nuclease with TOPRIM domain